MEVKYTNDGKKVVIIGNLNSQDKIVQEIFVTEGGQEIPSGENFVVASLHDTPVKSWKTYEQDKYAALEKSSKTAYDKLVGEISTKQGKLKDASLQLSDRIKWATGALQSINPEVFEFLVDFCAGNITHAVAYNYGDYNILTIEELVSYNENDRWSDTTYKNLRLISIYGYSEGKFDYRVNGYGDGSGSDKVVNFFKSEKEAIDFVSAKVIAKEKYTAADLSQAEKYGFKLDSDKLTTYHDSIKADIQKRVEEAQGKLLELQSDLKNYPNCSIDVTKSRAKK